MLANFKPWSVAAAEAAEGGLNLTYAGWQEWVAELEEEACLYGEREETLAANASAAVRQRFAVARGRRMIAAGRLADLENIIGGFTTKRDVALLLGKHRERARTLWTDRNRPVAPAGCDEAQLKEAAKALNKLREAAERLRSTKDAATRQKDAAWAGAWAASLQAALPSKLAAPPVEQCKLRSVWGAAANPARRSLGEPPANVQAVSNELTRPLPAAPVDKGPARQPEAGRRAGPNGPAEQRVAEPFAPVSDAEYEAAVAAWREAGAAAEHAPLNPEQRAGGSDVLRHAQLRAAGRARGETPPQIEAAARAEGLAPATLVVGAGGTGKSAMVHALTREFARLGLGKLLVTAYTGVAAAPFGGPTLMSLFNMSLKSKSQAHVRHADQALTLTLTPTPTLTLSPTLSLTLSPTLTLTLTLALSPNPNQAQLVARRDKFAEECGHQPEAIGAIVIDEVSFIELGMFGHVDMDMRKLLGEAAAELLMGGVPLLLCGDCHQKPPPGGTPWHHTMVKVALGEGDNPLASGATSAKQRGLTLLRAAKRVELRRLMRAQGDAAFIAFQQAMRRTDAPMPVPDAFLRALRPTSAADVAADSAWRFAPVGVLAHVERDAINHAQLEAFARAFELPLVRWRLTLVDDAFADPAVRERLYEHEPNLWGYFVEGAPVHLLETIKSVRKLVNGSPALLDSLVVTNDADRRLLGEKFGGGFSTIDLAEPPHAVNVVVGGTEEAPCLWHEVPLDDLSDLLPEYAGSRQMVPILQSSNREEAECYSAYGAQQGIAQKISVKQHQYAIAFALTDFKLQGRTLPKLVLSICKRARLPWMTLSSFYVLISRVRELAGLRLLQRDEPGLSAVAQLQTDEYLHGWERGYDAATGLWDDALAAHAIRGLRSARDREKKRAAEAKKAAAEAARAERAAQAAARKAQAPAQRKRPAQQRAPGVAQAPLAPAAGKKRRYGCTACGAEDHTAAALRCPKHPKHQLFLGGSRS